MKQISTSLLKERFFYCLTWVALLLLLCLGFQVKAQQSSLGAPNSLTSTPFVNTPFSVTQAHASTLASCWEGDVGLCVLGPNVPGRAIDNDLTNFARTNIAVSAISSLTVGDNNPATIYNAKNFAGFVISNSSLLEATLFGSVTIRTYKNGVFREASTSANLLGVSSSLISGAYEVGFYTTLDFNQISITFTNPLTVVTSYDVYYAVMRRYGPDNTPLTCNTSTPLNSPTFPAIVNPDNTGFGGLLSVGTIINPDNAISPSTNDAASLAITASALGTGYFSIKLQDQVFNSTTNALDDGYPAGTFAGIDLSNPSLLELGVGSGFIVQTYYHGTPTADIAASGGLFVAGNTALLTGTGRRTLGLVTTTKFDEIKLTVTGTGANVGTVLIYGAVVKRLCDAQPLVCNTTYPLSNTAFPTVIDPARTGLTGVLGVGASIQDEGNVISTSTTDFATITNTASVATVASIAVLNPISSYPAGTFAGFAVNKVAGVLALELFDRLTITTYRSGTLVESRSAGNLLDLAVTLFGPTNNFFNVGFVTTQAFDEIQLSVAPLVGAGVGTSLANLSGSLRVYGAFIDTRTSVGGGLVCALNTNPDFAVTNKNIPVTSSVKTNDKVPAGTTYGTSPTLTSSPGGSVPSLVMSSNGTYTFSSATPGVYVYSVPVCLSAICISQTLTITVLDPTVNTNNPVANPDIASTAGASTNPASLTVNVRVNDGPGNPGGTLANPTIVVNPTNGSASVNGSGNVVYTPNAGFYGSDVLTYQVCETPSTPACGTATVTITVIAPGSNNSTLAADDYISTYQGAAVSGNVKTNDTDPEGNTQTITTQNTTIPGVGTLVVAADGAYTFTPVAGATGPVDFSYTTTDNGSPSASANGTLHILINPFNPNPDFNVTDINVPVPGNVKTNDVVPVGTTYGTATLTSSPGSATLTLTPTGSYTFTASTPGVYTYNVPVCVTGTPPVCTTQTLAITVLDPAVNTNNPVANPDFATTTGAPTSPTALTVNIKVNDGPGNPGGALQNPTIPTQPAHGTASINGSGNLVYTPTAGYYGTDVVTYQICETPSTPACATATVTITVKAPGSPAAVSANDDYVSTSGGSPASGNVLDNDLGTGLSVSNAGTTVTSSGTLVLTSSGSYTFTPAPGATGPVDFTYTACDNNTPSTCASATLHVLINQGTPDLTPVIDLPQANFAATSPDNTRNFVVNIFEVGGQSTSSGNVAITLSAPTGYTIAFSSSITSISVSGGTTTPVDNTKWTETSNNGLQISLTINAGQFIAANATAKLGFTITRTTANTGSASNITVNVNDDATHTYDGNPLNNVYARIITGL